MRFKKLRGKLRGRQREWDERNWDGDASILYYPACKTHWWWFHIGGKLFINHVAALWQISQRLLFAWPWLPNIPGCQKDLCNVWQRRMGGCFKPSLPPWKIHTVYRSDNITCLEHVTNIAKANIRTVTSSDVMNTPIGQRPIDMHDSWLIYSQVQPIWIRSCTLVMGSNPNSGW